MMRIAVLVDVFTLMATFFKFYALSKCFKNRRIKIMCLVLQLCVQLSLLIYYRVTHSHFPDLSGLSRTVPHTVEKTQAGVYTVLTFSLAFIIIHFDINIIC